MLTDHAQFYRATLADDTYAFFSADDTLSRDKARAADTAGDPPIVAGFAVYDTNISTTYAVALYPEKRQAQAHEASTPAPAPEALFEEPAEDATPPAEDTAKPSTTKRRAGKTNKRNR
jgi:hypothetical protein